MAMQNLERLKFRRQFLFTAKECKQLDEWNLEIIDSHYLYVHPDCELNKLKNERNKLFLIGFAINPWFIDKTSLQILEDIAKFEKIEDIPDLIYGITGRFILLIKHDNKFCFFHDACGLRQMVYTFYENNLYAASQPLLLKLVVNIKRSLDYNTSLKMLITI